MRYVLDCSVAVKWFVPESLSGKARTLLRHFDAGAVSLIAPETITAEFGHALRKLVVGREMAAERSHAIMADFVAIPLETYAVRPLATDAMRLTTAHMTTFYDALYLALAEREDLRLVTADERMIRAFAKRDRTIWLADFPGA